MLLAVELLGPDEQPRILSRLEFDRPDDDPDRLALEPGGRFAWVSIRGSNRLLRVDLADPARMRVLESHQLPEGGVPGAIACDSRGSAIVVDVAFRRLVVWNTDADQPTSIPLSGLAEDAVILGPEAPNFVVATGVRDSNIEIVSLNESRMIGTLPIRGAAGLAKIRPAGVAWSAQINCSPLRTHQAAACTWFDSSSTSPAENRIAICKDNH